MGIIYKITNKTTGKVYIGQTKFSLRERWLQHIREANDALDGRISNFSLFHRAIIKYGASDFEPEIVEECDENDLDIKEKYWISFYNSLNDGYNSTCGGQWVKEEKKAYQKVSCFTKEGQYIKTFETAQDAANEFHVHPSRIRENCNGKCTLTSGLIWQWGDKKNLTKEKTSYRIGKGKKKRILQYDLNNNLIKKYDSIVSAAAETGCSKEGISKVCNNKQRTSGGYIWKFEFL